MAIRKLQQPVYIPEPQKRPVSSPEPARRPAVRRRFFTRLEKAVIASTVAISTFLGALVVQQQAAIHAQAVDIQKIEQQTDTLRKQNTVLTIQVGELSTYERVWKKAKELGLTLDDKNVKVVSNK